MRKEIEKVSKLRSSDNCGNYENATPGFSAQIKTRKKESDILLNACNARSVSTGTDRPQPRVECSYASHSTFDVPRWNRRARTRGRMRDTRPSVRERVLADKEVVVNAPTLIRREFCRTCRAHGRGKSRSERRARLDRNVYTRLLYTTIYIRACQCGQHVERFLGPGSTPFHPNFLIVLQRLRQRRRKRIYRRGVKSYNFGSV